MPEEDVEVQFEDQKSINTFGRLNTRLHELEEELKEKASQHELLDDAANEIILADDDEPIRRAARGPAAPSRAPKPPRAPRRYAFGECYFEVSKDQADELLESQKDSAAAEMKTIEDELSRIRGTLAELKKKLYAKFGSNINLEEQ